jgi:WhiB family redox-sensing transcriptional regulator
VNTASNTGTTTRTTHGTTNGTTSTTPQPDRAPRRSHPAPTTAGAGQDREVSPMQLSMLIDAQRAAQTLGDGIACREYDAELWFAERPEDVEFAKALCGPCPARVGCLAGALERREPWGVWGGQLIVQGAIVARKRPRGRPRKSEVAA